MPVQFIRNLHPGLSYEQGASYLVLWHITEQVSELKALLSERLQDTNSRTSGDHIHWLASRAALMHFFPRQNVEIIKDAFNKPHLLVDAEPAHISITHSHELAAVIVSKERHVSVDLERVDARIERVEKKFCSASELKMSSGPDKFKYLSVIWSAKETLYKFYGKKELHFDTQLSISPFKISGEDFLVEGSIVKDEKREILIHAEFIRDYVLTWIP